MLLVGALLAALATSARGASDDPRADYDVQDYRLELLVDPASQTVRGCGVIGGVVVAESLDAVVVDLAAPLQANGATQVAGDLFQKTLPRGDALAFDRVGDTVVVHLTAKLKRGERFQVAVWYSGRPLREDDFNGFQWALTPGTGQPWIASSCQTIGEHSWWPCKASYFH